MRTAKTTYRSNLENILQQFPFMTQKIETIEPYIRPPWWTSATKLRIVTTKDNTADLHEKLQTTAANSRDIMTIYTDGSGIKGKIGAAAYNATSEETNHQLLGDETHYNVYATKLTAIHLAVTQWEKSQTEYPICRIFIDNQAASIAISQPRTQSGQSIIKTIIDLIDEIMTLHPKRQLEMIWVPGHRGIEGNERADREAKRAATDPTLSRVFNHNVLKSARSQDIKTLAKTQWEKEWTENTTTAKQLRRMTTKGTAQRRPKIYNNLTS